MAVHASHPENSPASDSMLHTPDKIVWRNGPASLPAGAQFMVLEGDPTKEGLFVMRIKLPDGFQIRPGGQRCRAVFPDHLVWCVEH